MHRKIISAFCLCLVFFFAAKQSSYAIYNPLSAPNNFFGIHILFPEELQAAAKLVNSGGGDWGYVLIPIQAKDKNLLKWQAFMNTASQMHVIPILRLSTEEDFSRKGTWRKPDAYDIVDFANFLNSLRWPTENRYVVLFNEVNRYDEWSGENPEPDYYTELVSFAYQVFKARSPEFFLILGAFDNASVTGKNYINEFDYLGEMEKHDPDIFNEIDGIASHSYPNPGFSQPPSAYRLEGTSTYKFEYSYINAFSRTKKPVFITETGWDNRVVSPDQIGKDYEYAFQNIWEEDKDKIVAITPFLLEGEGQYGMFSFINNGKLTSYYTDMYRLQKDRGLPNVLTAQLLSPLPDFRPVTEFFKAGRENSRAITIPPILKLYLKMVFGLK